MPGPGQAQPDLPGILVFTMEDVRANEPGTPPSLPPSTVITAGSSVVLTSTFGVTGLLTGLLTGQVFDVVHHVENLETSAHTNLPGGTFTVPAPPAAGVIAYTSPTFTTGATASGANFEIPAGFEGGTFRILTHVHAQNPFIRSIVAAFHDGLVIEVI
jgi:hypothetical protein